MRSKTLYGSLALKRFNVYMLVEKAVGKASISLAFLARRLQYKDKGVLLRIQRVLVGVDVV